MPRAHAPGTLDQVREYYGRTLQRSQDLKTGACCSTDSMPEHVRSILPLIEREVTEKFYGCGSPIPLELAGRTVLDLGCGTGRDVFLVAKLVGPDGRVIGVDMTEQQLAVARRNADAQARRFGFAQANTEFHLGYIEDLAALDVADASVDVVISNCVINLSPDKRRVFSEIFRVLKPGGELYFSDIFAGRRVPSELADETVLRGECLGGAMYIEDFRRLLCERGCPDYRVAASRPISLNDPDVVAKVGMIDFHSMTIRIFKLDGLEDRCEDYGQVAIYRGSIAQSPHHFALDDHHTFHTGQPALVCGNTAAMLEGTRYAKHFTVLGDRSTHFGPFHGQPAVPTMAGNPAADACC